MEATVLWVNCNESALWPGDLALPGDTIRVIVNTTGAAGRPVTLIACGPECSGSARLHGWPYPFTGCCWRQL